MINSPPLPYSEKFHKLSNNLVKKYLLRKSDIRTLVLVFTNIEMKKFLHYLYYEKHLWSVRDNTGEKRYGGKYVKVFLKKWHSESRQDFTTGIGGSIGTFRDLYIDASLKVVFFTIFENLCSKTLNDTIKSYPFGPF